MQTKRLLHLKSKAWLWQHNTVGTLLCDKHCNARETKMNVDKCREIPEEKLLSSRFSYRLHQTAREYEAENKGKDAQVQVGVQT